jgi:hypothetical protein
MLVCGLVSIGFSAEEIKADKDLVFGSDTSTGGFVEESSMQDILSGYLAKNNWIEGENVQNGNPIFIATGVGVISANKNSPAYISARINAFDKAFLRAKQQMTEYLGMKISTEAMLSYSEGDVKAIDQSENGLPSLWDKAKTLMHAKLDQMLNKEGAKDENADKDKLEKLAKSSEEYRRLTKTMASAMVSGLQAFKVYETAGEIGVVAIYSKKLNELAYAVAADRSLPLEAKRGLPLIQQVANISNILWSSFGTVQKIDENGERVLVAFGQSMPVTPSQQSRNMAERAAKSVALGYMRSFAGEMIKTSQDILRADSVKEYENLTSTYKDHNAYRESISTTADKINFSGVQTIYRWRAAHPLNGAEVCGVVLVWSPSRSQKAHVIESRMKQEQADGTAGNNIKQPIALPRISDVKVNSGVEGDKDSL